MAIDLTNLQYCCQVQAQLLHEVSDELAFAISAKDAAKTAVKEEYSFAADALRKEHEKISEAKIDSLIVTDKQVMERNKTLLELELKVGRLFALKEAYQDRSKMLELEVKLYLANYFNDNVERTEKNLRAEMVRKELTSMGNSNNRRRT